MGLEDLTRYESASVAGMKAKENPMSSLTAMDNFYNITGMSEDYFVQDGLKRAQESLMRAAQTGQEMTLANTGLLEAIAVNNAKYAKAFNEEKISGLVKYLEGSSSLPEEAKQGLLEYGDITYKELIEKSKVKDLSDEDKKKIKNVLMLISELKDLKLEKYYIGMKTKSVEAVAKQLYSKPEKETYPKSEEKEAA